MVGNRDKKHLHIGVLFGTLVSYCQYRIWDGIVEFAKQNDISLTAFFGTYHTTDSDFIPHYETCMEAITGSSLDGMIFTSSSITIDMKPDYYIQFVKKISEKMPVVSAGSLLPDIPSVAVNSVDGIYTLVNHLIKYHNKKKIAFIKGPELTWEAEERFNGYKKALADNGFNVDDKYILPGRYLEENGAAAVTEIMDNRKIPVDAIVASNDVMASGVLRELKSRGIKVPTDIAVTGFDDDVISWKTNPPITTVKQDFYNLGMVSSEVLYNVINNKPVKEIHYLPTLPVLRQSCGCYEGERLNNEADADTAADEDDSLLSYTTDKVKHLFDDIASSAMISRWISALINVMKEDDFTKEKLRLCLYDVMNEYKQHSEDRYVWCDVLHTLIVGSLRYRDEIDFTQTTLSALISAITLVQNIIHNERQAAEYEANEFRMAISRVANALVSSFDIESLAEELCRSLPTLFIETAIICLYRDRVENNDPCADRRIATVIGYDAGNIIRVERSGQDDTLPFVFTSLEGFEFDRERRTTLLYPLFFGGEELGIVLLSYDSRVPMDAYAGLRIDISTAVKGASLLTKINALSIVDELTGLYNRRGFFRYAEARLKYMSRENSPLIPVVLFLDLDKLKTINDMYGHREGDTAIAVFAHILKESLREVDVIGRMGGDEFVVLSSVDSVSNIPQLECRLRDKLAEYNDKRLHPYDIGASIGSAPLDVLTMQSLEDAILKADGILYEDKERKKRLE